MQVGFMAIVRHAAYAAELKPVSNALAAIPVRIAIAQQPVPILIPVRCLLMRIMIPKPARRAASALPLKPVGLVIPAM